MIGIACDRNIPCIWNIHGKVLVATLLGGKSRELAKVTEFDEVFPLTPILCACLCVALLHNIHLFTVYGENT